jgi:lysyl-tRNA synthetase class 2
VGAPGTTTKRRSGRAGCPLDSRGHEHSAPLSDRDEIAAVRAEAEAGAAGDRRSTRSPAASWAAATSGARLLDLVDRSGQIQLLCQPDELDDFDPDLGDVVGVRGAATKTKRGEPSLSVTEFQLLAKIKRPLPDTYHGLVDAETRYRKRYLDLLVNEEARRDFLVRSELVAAIRRYLDARGFVEVETPDPPASLRGRAR